jgi:hypothetical protein
MSQSGKLEELKQTVARSLVISSDHLMSVPISAVSDNEMAIVGELMREKECYTNSLLSALAIGADRVVLGAVYISTIGISVEHSWLAFKDERHVYPTYQKMNGSFEPTNYEYFSLYEITIDEYLEVSESIRGIPDMAVDFLALRMSPKTDYLFKQKTAA